MISLNNKVYFVILWRGFTKKDLMSKPRDFGLSCAVSMNFVKELEVFWSRPIRAEACSLELRYLWDGKGGQKKGNRIECLGGEKEKTERLVYGKERGELQEYVGYKRCVVIPVFVSFF